MTFTRYHTPNAEQRPNRSTPRPQRPVRACSAGWYHEGAVARDAIGRDRCSRPWAGANDAAKVLQRGSLEPNEALCRRGGKPSFLGEWMVDDPDEPQSAPMGEDRLFEIGEREAVDYRRGIVGESGQCGSTIIGGKLDDLHRVPAGPQAVDDVPIVKITTG